MARLPGVRDAAGANGSISSGWYSAPRRNSQFQAGHPQAKQIRPGGDICSAIPVVPRGDEPAFSASPGARGVDVPFGQRSCLRPEFRSPCGRGVGTARAIAHAYGVFACGGKELGLREETLRQLMAPPIAPLKGLRDGALKVEVQFSLGFTKPSPKHPFASPGSFGAPGTGGSFGFADPQAGIGYGYVLNGMGWHLEDSRELALRTAMYRSVGESAR